MNHFGLQAETRFIFQNILKIRSHLSIDKQQKPHPYPQQWDSLQKATQEAEHWGLTSSSPSKAVPFMKGPGGRDGFCVSLAVLSHGLRVSGGTGDAQPRLAQLAGNTDEPWGRKWQPWPKLCHLGVVATGSHTAEAGAGTSSPALITPCSSQKRTATSSLPSCHRWAREIHLPWAKHPPHLRLGYEGSWQATSRAETLMPGSCCAHGQAWKWVCAVSWVCLCLELRASAVLLCKAGTRAFVMQLGF